MKSVLPRVIYCGPEDPLFKKLARTSEDLHWEAKPIHFTGSPQQFAKQSKATALVLKVRNEFDLKHQEWLSRNDSSIPVIVLCQNGTIQTAIEALQYGIFDYFCAAQDAETILQGIRDATREWPVWRLKRPRDREEQLLLGEHPEILEINEQARKFAQEGKPILLRGENGTGKEHLAGGMYRLSSNASRPFPRYDCKQLLEWCRYDGRSLPELVQLKMQELRKTSETRFLFLDHAEKLSADQLGEVLDRGSRSRVTLVASYQESGKSRMDERIANSLSYLRIPSLRQHKEDIPLIADYFLRKFGQNRKSHRKGISEELMIAMQEYAWPGNIQEFRNVIERMIFLESSGVLTSSTWHICRGFGFSSQLDVANPFSTLLEDALTSSEAQVKGNLYGTFMTKMERMLIDLVLPKVDFKQAVAARILGISRNTLRERLKSGRNY